MTETPEQPAPSPPPEPPPQAEPPAARSTLKILYVVAAVVALAVAGFFIWRMQAGGAGEAAYTVEPYTPATEMITAREPVEGREAPDAASPIAVMFGQGVTLNITGRVSRGLGNDWYAIGWNGQTVFVRQADAVEGEGAPPPLPERVNQPEEIKEPEEEEQPDEEEVAVFPDVPSPGGTLDIGDVAWIREPSSRDFARYFPQRALDDEQSGRVTLDCSIAGNGRLDCGVASEDPPGYGFGNAAVSISRQLRVDSTLPDGSPAAGRRLRLPLAFRAG